MYEINSCSIVGRLTADPKNYQTKDNNTLSKFSIANNQGEKVHYFDIVCYGKVATSVSKYLKKGSQIIVEGKLQQERWTDKDGHNRSKHVIFANQVQFLDKREKSEPNGNVKDDNIDAAIIFDDENNEEVPF